MRRKIRLTENGLNRLVSNSVRRALNEIDYSNFDFSKTNGIDLSDTRFGVTPKDVKEGVLNLQNAVKNVMDLMNGRGAGEAFDREMWHKCYDFYNFISKYYIELKQDCRDIDGSWEEDHTDIPFIRKYGDDYTIPQYYGKDGKPIDRSAFRTNYKPHNKK